MTMSRAADVMMRPVRWRPRETARSLLGAVPVELDDAREQEDLVVHRQAEPEGEHEEGHHRLDGPDRREAEQALEVALLEDPHDDAERGAERDDVEQQGLDREDDRARS